MVFKARRLDEITKEASTDREPFSCFPRMGEEEETARETEK